MIFVGNRATTRAERCLVSALSVMLAVAPVAAQEAGRAPRKERPDLGVVRINFITESMGGSNTFELKGRKIPDYRPRIVQVFPSTGVVMDERGHVLTFLGYRWVDIHASRPVVEIFTQEGQKHPGKLIGIDQSMGVAVVVGEGVKMRPTPLCEKCEIRDGTTVVVPVLENEGIATFQDTRILSVGAPADAPRRDGWVIRLNRQLHGIGEPLLNTNRQVLGFIADQKPSPADPAGVQTIVYPITQLLSSARKIMKASGDVQTGWLGVFIEDAEKGIIIRRVQGNSPAQKAGLKADDVIVKYNGMKVGETRHFIKMVQDTRIGSKVALEVLRQGKMITQDAMIDMRAPDPGPEPITLSFPGSISLRSAPGTPNRLEAADARYGIEIVSMTQQLAGFLQVPVQNGLLVSSVDASKLFGRAGLQAGDILLQVDGIGFSDSAELLKHLNSRGREKPLDLRIFRKGTQHTIKVDLASESPSKKR